ncbi:MAG: class I SAM-dependent methyltransferase [Candidatus Rokuibacteriota bacterium]
MTATREALDEAKVKAFTQRMVSHFTGASVALMIEVGRQSGLFEALAAMPPATSAAIAERAGLTERYVREWLGAMVCGGIVEYDAAARTYDLPPEHAVLLTGQTSRNLSSLATFFPLLTRVVPELVQAFRTGGGVPYAAYQPDFTGLMDSRSRPRYQELLLTKYLGSPEGLIARLEAGIRVADIGCGTGFCINLMATHFPRSTFVGYDFSEAAIARARAEAAAMGVTNVAFMVQDVAKLPAEPTFDLITAFDAIHDQIDPGEVLRRLRAALAPGGVFLMLDVHASSNLEDNVSVPLSAFLYTVSTMHCMTVSLAHGGAGLGTVWGTQLATRMLHEAGFTEVRLFERVDPINSLYVAR